MRSSNKIGIIIAIIIILVLAVAGTVVGILYMTTDVFFSKEQKFNKYFAQNIEIINQIIDSKTYETYQNLENESLYDSETNIDFSYSEGGEISNPINELSAKLSMQKDEKNEYFYANGQILFEDKEYLKAELIRNEELAGIRFSNVVKQFVTIKEDDNLENVAQDLEVEENQLIECIDLLNGKFDNKIFSKEELNNLLTQYINIVLNNISYGQYSKLNNAMITINNNTIKTNAYSVELNSEQVLNLLIEILESVKTEEKILNIAGENIQDAIDDLIKKLKEYEEIPGLKITVYEKDGYTVQTTIEIGMNKILIEDLSENSDLKLVIQVNEMNSEKEKIQNIEISKSNSVNQEEYEINIESINGDDKNTISILSTMQSDEDSISTKTDITYKKDIIAVTVSLKNDINTTKLKTDKMELNEENNVVLNDLDQERRMITINLLKENVPVVTSTRMKLLQQKLNIQSNSEGESGNEEEPQMSETEKNKFNAKFEFYTGEAVNKENVETLLGIVKNHLASIEYIEDNQTNTEENNNEKEILNVKLNIEKDKVNEQLIEELLDKLKRGKDYKVTITYNNEDNLISYITIKELDE